jgi:hypothetical protein
MNPDQLLIDKIATAASHEFFMLLRNWTGFDARIFHHQRLGGIITAAITRAREQEDLMYRYHNDARFHAFVERLQAETLECYKEHHGISGKPLVQILAELEGKR